ncbi:MAG TPA: DUF3179 domain-containing (seleno)protein, partial [Candidatus Caenarcaniphilales bacterium]|nr:DUF3179 domain-containing (seleno)protein [Candidatus Caenarcaniphilales bacterium]
LTFERQAEEIIDRETGSTWSITGVATAGTLAGSRLESVPHGDHFWFAWAAFRPDTRIWSSGDAVEEENSPRASASATSGLLSQLPTEVAGSSVEWLPIDVDRVLLADAGSVDIADLGAIVEASGVGAARFEMAIGAAITDDGTLSLTAFRAPTLSGAQLARIVGPVVLEGMETSSLHAAVVTAGTAVVLVTSADETLHAAGVEAVEEVGARP